MKYKLIIPFLFLHISLFAQKKESGELFKKFITVCNAYKQLPLQLTIEYKKNSNIIMHKEDSTTAAGTFFMDKGNAYISFGGAEQIVTDSLVLVVMSNIKQMLLSKNTAAISTQVNNMINAPVKDSSVEEFMKKYTITQKAAVNGKGTLEILNKSNIYNTEIPVESISLLYNINNGYPEKVITVKRSLVKKPAGANDTLAATAVTIPGKGDYIIKEDSVAYVYTSIKHDTNKSIPILLSDRITKDASNNYIPVKAYQDYKLIEN